jgi:hypothetical protein
VNSPLSPSRPLWRKKVSILLGDYGKKKSWGHPKPRFHLKGYWWRIPIFEFSPLRGSFFLSFCGWFSGLWPLNQPQNENI